MARAGAIALLVVSLFGAGGLEAQTGARSARKAPARQIFSPRWTAGYSLWTENLQLTRNDGRAFKVASSARAFSFGYQWDWMQRRKGWFLETQAHFGEATSMSRDEDLTYFQKSSPLMGASLTGMYHWNFEKPRLFMGLGLGSLFRQVTYEVPAGYSFRKYSQNMVHHLKVDLSFPVAPRTEVIQQFGIPLDGHGHFWQIGIRRL